MRGVQARGRRFSRLVTVWLFGAIVIGGFIAWSPQSSGDTWKESSEADFLGGTLTGVTVLPSGDVVLATDPAGVPTYTRQGVVLDVGPPGSADSVKAYHAFVLRESDGSYKMWYQGSDNQRFRMLFADSLDGISWTKRGVILDVQTAPENWDAVAAMSVIKEGTTYHMWFSAGFWTGGPAGFWSQIYHATSTDGMTWTNRAVALGLGAPGAWDDSSLLVPSVVRDPSGTYRLYYAGWDGVTPGYRIGLATSSTYTGFTRYGTAPVLNMGSPGAWDDVSVSTPFVSTGSQWRMYYVASDGATGRGGLAFSDDEGYTWMKWAGNPWLAPAPPPAWDDGGIGSAMDVWTPTGKRLYYAGSSGALTRTGYATLSDLVASGTYTSRVFDAGGLGTTWQFAAWNATTPASTTVSLSVRVGDTPTPDGTWSAWTPVVGPSSGTPLSLSRTRYLQYMAALATTDGTVTPALHDVTFTFEVNGRPSVLTMDPSGGAWSSATPALSWTFADPDGDPQSAFEVQFSADPSFSDFISSGVRDSPAQAWQPSAFGDGVWHWRVRVRDSYGMWSAWSAESFGVDGTPPVTSASWTGTPGAGGWYTSQVTVTLAAADATSGVAATEYRLDGSAWQTYAAPVSVAGDGLHRIEFYSTDVAGNVGPIDSATFRIDASPPQTTAFTIGTMGSSGWYTGPVTVALDRTDATSGIASTAYRVDGGSWQTYATPFVVSADGTHLAEFHSTDRAGVVETVRSLNFRIDATAPGATASLSGPLGTNGWYTGAVTISLSGTDATSGLFSVRYRVDGGSWQSYTTPFAITGDGSHEIEFVADDNAGVQGSVQSVAFRIDATPPATSAAMFGQPGGGGYYTTSVAISLAADDATSGVASTRYRVDDGPWQTYVAPFEVSGDGPHRVEYDSTDGAGIPEVTRSVSFDIDTTAPFSEVALDGQTGQDGWFTGAVTVALSATDATSGISSAHYRVDGGTWQVYAVPFVVAGDGVHAIEFFSVDVAGIVEGTRFTLAAIDTTAPTSVALLSGTEGDGGFRTSPVAVALAAADATSGVALIEYRLDGGPWQPHAGPFLVSADGAHTVDFHSTDRAGLAEASRSESFELDTTPPATTATLSGPRGVVGFFTGPVTASLSATDATSGVSATQYRVDGDAWSPYAGPFEIASEGLHVVEFRSTDHAGLEEPLQVVTFSIDKAPLSPTGPYGPSLLVLLVAVVMAFLAFLIGAALGRRKGRKEAEGEPASESESAPEEPYQ